MGRPRFARLLAPLALVVCAAAVLLVVQHGLQEGTGDAATTATTTVTTTPATKRTRYRVRSGDTLGAISDKVDVPIDRILELNPKVDPQSLRAGSLLRLRR